MLLNLRKTNHLRTIRALDSERLDDLFDHSRSSSNFDVLMAHRAIFIQDEPVFNAKLAEQLIAIVTFFGVSGQF